MIGALKCIESEVYLHIFKNNQKERMNNFMNILKNIVFALSVPFLTVYYFFHYSYKILFTNYDDWENDLGNDGISNPWNITAAKRTTEALIILIIVVLEFYKAIKNAFSKSKAKVPSTKSRKNKKNKIPINELEVSLTPIKYLNANERRKRQDIISCKNPLLLHMVHEEDNPYDSYALEVFHNDIKVGYVAKRGVEEAVNSFSFTNNKLKYKIHLIWDGNRFLVTRKNIETTLISTPKIQHTHQLIIEPSVSYKKLYKSIPIYLESKGIQQFYHFTDIRNLESIIQNGGLYSWYGIQKKGISSLLSSNDLSRQLDVNHKLQDYIRLAFHSYHPMSTRLIYEENKDLIWLEIDVDVACWESTLFSDINATDNNVKVDGDFDFLKTLDLNIFKYEYRDLDLSGKKKYQAEVLVKEFLPIKYIKNIDILRGRYM